MSQSPAHSFWEQHDRDFHTVSRGLGSAPQSFGATYRFGHEPPPETAWKERTEGDEVQLLPTPDLPQSDFDTLLARRATTYEFGPVTPAQLNGLLYQSFRVRGVTGEDAVKKAYPSGGGLHSLEMYLAVENCVDLPVGAYFYDGYLHGLFNRPCHPQQIEDTVSSAARAMARLPRRPAAVAIVTARFKRVFWKYEGLGYRLILLEAGALLQTMYLAAAQLGLSVCAVGSGSSALFPTVSGRSLEEEAPVLELAINGPLPKAKEPA